MTDKQIQEQAPKGNMLKEPDQWTTGEEPMTGAQRSYLKTLSEEAGEPFNEHLTKAEASKRIEATPCAKLQPISAYMTLRSVVLLLRTRTSPKMGSHHR